MLLNRDQKGWAIFTLIATILLGLLFTAKYYPSALPFRIELPAWLGPGPGAGRKIGATPVGLSYGILAFLIFLFAAALAFRKKVPLWRLGSARFWLRAHVWLTILTFPLVFMHADFKAGAPITFWLLILYGVVMLSGFYGLALQQVLPRLMMERIPLETVYEQIPYLRKRFAELALELRETILKEQTKVKEETKLKEETDKAAAEARQKEPEAAAGETAKAEPASTPAAVATEIPVDARLASLPTDTGSSLEAVLDALEKEVLPYLMVRRTESLSMSRQQYSDQVFRILKLTTTQAHREWISQMESWCDERRSMELQTRYQHWLHSWLLVHVPSSFLLIGYTAWHAAIALFNY